MKVHNWLYITWYSFHCHELHIHYYMHIQKQTWTWKKSVLCTPSRPSCQKLRHTHKLVPKASRTVLANKKAWNMWQNIVSIRCECFCLPQFTRRALASWQRRDQPSYTSLTLHILNVVEDKARDTSLCMLVHSSMNAPKTHVRCHIRKQTSHGLNWVHSRSGKHTNVPVTVTLAWIMLKVQK